VLRGCHLRADRRVRAPVEVGYTVPFTLIHVGKYRPEYKHSNPEKQTCKTQQNCPGLVASYDTRPGNEVGLFYNAPEPTSKQGKLLFNKPLKLSFKQVVQLTAT